MPARILEGANRKQVPLLAFVVCAAGAVLSVLSWKALQTFENRQIRTELQATSLRLARLMESELALREANLKDLAQFWSEFGDAARWESDAKLFMKTYEDILGLEWDDASSSAPYATGTEEGLQLLADLHGQGAIAVRRDDADGAIQAFPATELGQPATYVVAISVALEQGGSNVLTALMRPSIAFERIFSSGVLGAALSISDEDLALYELGEPVTSTASPDMVHKETVDALADRVWTLSVRPSQEMIAVTKLGLPWVVLGAGLIISVLLASLVRSGQLSAARYGELMANAMELSGRVKELDRDKVLLQTSNAEKDAQVHELENRLNSVSADQNPAMAELEAFTYSVSHDLRSPMGAILNYAAILAEDSGEALGEEGRDHLARISSSARTAVSMMDGLLAFSRVGRAELKLADVNVRRMVKEIHEELSQSQRSSSRQVRLSVGDLPMVRADATLLRILFTNLLSNAFKFTNQIPEPTVEVGGYVQGGETTYYVKDNGVGFEMENAARIFGVFERLHAKDDYDGHGVGLALVDRIARRHGGSVRAEGAVGKGATFFVNLPNEPASA